MFRVVVECKNVRSEKLAKYLDEFTDGFKIWMHDDTVYALFDLESLDKLKELSKRLKRVKDIEFSLSKLEQCSTLKDEDLLSVLTEDLDDEILGRAAEWFKVLRKAYKRTT